MRRRDLWAVPALVACGNAMNFDNANGVHPRKSPQLPSVYDFRSLSSASLLYAGFDIEYGQTAASTMLAASASHPVVTLSGNLRQWPILGLRIQCRSATTFDWSIQNGWGWQNGIGVRGATIPNGGTYTLTGTGITANFPAGTYSSACNYRATVGKLESFGPVANCDLDNTSVFASRGFPVEAYGMNNRLPSMFRRNETGLSPQALGNTGALPALVAGSNKAFEIWDLWQNNSSNYSTQPAAHWCFSNSTNNTYDYLDTIFYGPDVEPGAQQRYLFRRRAQGAAIVTATANQALDNSWLARRIKFDGSVLQVSMHGKDLWEGSPVPWTSGALTCNQFVLGAILLGTNAASNLPYWGFNKWLGYSGVLSDSQAREMWRALS